MRALESLERDHQLLQGLSDALEAYVGALETGQPLRPGDLKALVEALRFVADYLLFEKVEEVLIPLLVRSGFRLDAERLEDERDDFAHVRHAIAVLHQSAEREPSWNLDERERIIRVARHLIEMQQRIATHQVTGLLPGIVARLEPSALAMLTRQLGQFDESKAARASGAVVVALTRGVLARYATRLRARPGAALDAESAFASQPGLSAQEAFAPPAAASRASFAAQAGMPKTLQLSRDLPSTRELAR